MAIQFYPIPPTLPTEQYHNSILALTEKNQLNAAEQKAAYVSNSALFWHNMQVVFSRLAGITRPQVIDLAGRVCRYFARGEKCIQPRCRFYHCVATQYALETLKNREFKTERCPVPTVCELSGRKVSCHRIHRDEPANPWSAPKPRVEDACPKLPGLEAIREEVVRSASR